MNEIKYKVFNYSGDFEQFQKDTKHLVMLNITPIMTGITSSGEENCLQTSNIGVFVTYRILEEDKSN